MKKSIVVYALGLSVFVSATSYARIGDAEPRNRTQAEWKPEIVSYSGEVRIKKDCEECGGSKGDCEMEFVREEDKREFDLDSNPELAQALSKTPRSHLKVKLVAEKKPGFFFWGGGLSPRTFEVVAELPAHLCMNQSPKVRESAFRGKALF